MKRSLFALFLVAPVAAMAKPPQRFLGPPVKKPADAGTPADAADGGAPGASAAPHPGETPDPPVLKVGDEAPQFSGVLHNAEQAGMPRIDLSSLVGTDAETPAKAVLISFFATWCKPCKKELPFLQQLSSEYKEKGLRVISVAIDRDEAQWPLIKDLVVKNHVTFPVVKDRYNIIARQYLGLKTQLPSVFIVGRDGNVALVKQGYTDDAAQFLRAEVEKALQ
jgi:thiol-disulfide isomerase/thioredoxin